MNSPMHLLWEIGKDYDCESCGLTWNNALFSYTPEDKVWRFSYTEGCYGGAEVASTDFDCETRLEELFIILKEFPEWSKDYELEVRKAIGEIND
jgi:hypothetical protein